MIDCIRAWKRELDSPGWHPSMAHPATWLHQGGWKSYLESETAAGPSPEDAAKLAETIAMYGTYAEPILARLSSDRTNAEAKFREWFGKTAFTEPARIVAETKCVARFIADNWGAALRRIIGEDLTIEIRSSAAKAA
jgi:hypothetical protein